MIFITVYLLYLGYMYTCTIYIYKRPAVHFSVNLNDLKTVWGLV